MKIYILFILTFFLFDCSNEERLTDIKSPILGLKMKLGASNSLIDSSLFLLDVNEFKKKYTTINIYENKDYGLQDIHISQSKRVDSLYSLGIDNLINSYFVDSNSNNKSIKVSKYKFENDEITRVYYYLILNNYILLQHEYSGLIILYGQNL